MGAKVDVSDEGVFWLVKSKDVFIQGQYSKSESDANRSNLVSVAAGGGFLKNNTFVIRPLTGKMTWNGEEILADLNSEFSNHLIHATYNEHAGTVQDGQRGNFNGDPADDRQDVLLARTGHHIPLQDQ